MCRRQTTLPCTDAFFRTTVFYKILCLIPCSYQCASGTVYANVLVLTSPKSFVDTWETRNFNFKYLVFSNQVLVIYIRTYVYIVRTCVGFGGRRAIQLSLQTVLITYTHAPERPRRDVAVYTSSAIITVIITIRVIIITFAAAARTPCSTCMMYTGCMCLYTRVLYTYTVIFRRGFNPRWSPRLHRRRRRSI